MSDERLEEIEQRYRDDPNMYWATEVEWLITEVKQQREQIEQLRRLRCRHR